MQNAPQDELKVNIRSKTFSLVEGASGCWKCKARTRLFGFLLPAGFETLEPVDVRDRAHSHPSDGFSFREVTLAEMRATRWEVHQLEAMPSYLNLLPASVMAAIRPVAPNLRVDYSQAVQASYLMNHCDSCGMKQGDNAALAIGGPVVPLDAKGFAQRKIHPFNVAFEASCANLMSGFD